MSTLFIKDPKDYGSSFLLKGGENHGALIEHQRAKEWGLRIYYQTPKHETT